MGSRGSGLGELAAVTACLNAAAAPDATFWPLFIRSDGFATTGRAPYACNPLQREIAPMSSTPMSLERLFGLMAEKSASDLFLSVGSPITIKINGVCVPIN